MRLEDAVRALRDETSEPFDQADETRSRVVAKLEQSRRRRSKRLFVVLPAAAVLAGATAFAGVSDKFPSAWHSALRVLRLSPSTPSAVEPPRPSSPAPLAAAPSAEPAAIDVPAPIDAPSPAATLAPRPKPKATRAPTPGLTSIEPPTEPPPSAPAAPAAPDSLALYRTAHRLHFSQQDPSAALMAWDAYLREDPAGAFALEARYNRALCLVRLGRSREAREALAPFADGRLGGYRKSEARALLAVLDAEAPPE